MKSRELFDRAIEIYWKRYWQGRGYERLPEAAGEYRLRLARDGTQAAFGSGWMNRAYA